ncbi:MAG: PfkB family carbohydrate kinase, partial [Actinomycetota bacterium]|nr:PfkB family carbohydrate kinase [Actinomycetota bacterium]
MRPLGVIGNLSRDIVGRTPPRVGGGPYYAARALRELGRRSALAVRCSPEDRRAFVPKLAALGVPVTWRASSVTTTFSFRYEGERRLMRVEAVGDPWTPEDVRSWAGDAIGRADWVHAAPLLRSDFSADTLAELARGRRLSFDGQGLVRRPEVGSLRLDAEFEPELLRFVSVLKLAEEEAEVLVGDLDEASLASLGVPEVVVTLGSRGSLVVVDGRLERVTARAAKGRVDPTGAGDA